MENYLDTPVEYGSEIVNHFIPEGTNARRLDVTSEIKPIANIRTKLDEILASPVESPALSSLIKKNYTKGKPVVILVDDNTRPNTHTRILLPILIQKIEEFGVKPKDIKILVAGGTHRPPTAEEIEKKILGTAIWNKYKEQVIAHDCDKNVKKIGTSSRGTPILVDEVALGASIIVALTDSEYHYFAGVAGTVKQLFPGVAGRETISKNHPRAFNTTTGFLDECHLSNTAGNPVIEDMIEMAQIVQKQIPVFCIDAILYNEEIVHLHAGDIVALHKLAKELLEPLRVVQVEKGADLVIITTGELSLNLYQAGKGVHAAWNATAKGGTILLLARAEDGVGNQAYHDTMLAVKDMALDEALSWVVANKCTEETFRIGNQKPVDLLRILKETKIDAITEMDHKELKETFRINPIKIEKNLQQTLRRYISNFLSEKPDALIYVMTNAGIYVIPKIK